MHFRLKLKLIHIYSSHVHNQTDNMHHQLNGQIFPNDCSFNVSKNDNVRNIPYLYIYDVKIVSLRNGNKMSIDVRLGIAKISIKQITYQFVDTKVPYKYEMMRFISNE